MSREVHVRFWESVEVRFLRATRLSLPTDFSEPHAARLPPQLDFEFEQDDGCHDADDRACHEEHQASAPRAPPPNP